MLYEVITIKGDVVKMEPADKALKIPHMGWNELQIRTEHPVFDGIASGDHAYFVHSYHLVPENADDLLATVEYGGTITAAVGRGNMVGTQFHPENRITSYNVCYTKLLRPRNCPLWPFFLVRASGDEDG